MPTQHTSNAPAILPKPDVPSRESILACLRDQAVPLTPEDLMTVLGVSPDFEEGFTRRLAAMERDGQLLPNRNGVLLLATKLDFIAGKVQGHRDGFGFLIRDDLGADMFLSTREMEKVMHGDRVLARQIGTDRRGKPEATIVEVTERAQQKLVGRLINERGVLIVVPENNRIKHDIMLPPQEAVHAQPGQVVVVELLQQPSRYNPPIGRIIEVLGDYEDSGMEIEIAVRKYDVPYEFPPQALQQAEALPNAVRAEDLVNRVDLRDVPLVTIDGEDARDFDDAVYCESITFQKGKVTTNGWRLLVAIADVSHYVQPTTPLDIESQNRATSVYFPRRVIPMLPEKLSNGLCSLNPQVDRLCLVCDMVIYADGEQAGEMHAYQFYPAVMHSAARLTYNEVWNVLSNPTGLAAVKRREIAPHLHNLYALFGVLAQARTRRGALDFETTETYIVANEAGKIEQILPRTRNDAHKLIEECMLAANVCSADFLQRANHIGLYRVHEGPTAERLENLKTFLRTCALTLEGGDQPTTKNYAKLTQVIKGRPDYELLQSMILRSMQQAVYTPHNLGHFGLGYAAYSHFTSPIRRYPDLLTHRAIKALLQKKQYAPQVMVLRNEQSSSTLDENGLMNRWEQLGALCSANERRADEASRDVMAWLKCYFMKDKVGEQFSGVVSAVASFGMFITLDRLYVEGLVHISDLGTDYFKYEEALQQLRGEHTGKRYRIGDRVDISVLRINMENRKIDFKLLPKEGFESVMAAGHSHVSGQSERDRSTPKKTTKIPKATAKATPAKKITKAVEVKPATQSATKTTRKPRSRKKSV
jgi:ribonuclease R